ncbi:hypothetical protein NBRC110019_14650 [Neptunitalea chrysea]|uniref:DUF2007 domain-containing protein n=1 Tax=Neptunitalea chrysea TaxID=1647581 RepID=A0A9W6B6D3_9FLAO|nr:DUF2007 domain-containing protein [Neptunitalea chrysea]GLB52425.1 hypothetical protein NBRC110019_14650 [Neptunitalea chrysea]
MKDFEKIFEGSSIAAQQIVSILEENNIEPIIKDETESGRLAGFAPKIINNVQVFVHKNELDKGKAIVTSFEQENV